MRASKGSKAYPRVSTGSSKRGASKRSTARQETRDKAVVNDTFVKPFNPSDGRGERQAGLDAFHKGLKPIKQRAGSSGKGTPVTLGAELVTNGTFDSDLTGWTADTGWIQFSGIAVTIVPVADADLYQVVTGTGTDKEYIISFRAVGTNTNDIPIAFQWNGTTVYPQINGTGPRDYTIRLWSLTATPEIRFSANAGCNDGVDNVSVKEIA